MSRLDAADELVEQLKGVEFQESTCFFKVRVEVKFLSHFHGDVQDVTCFDLLHLEW